MSTVIRPQGPRTRLWGIKDATDMARKPLQFLNHSSQTYGDIVYHRFGPYHTYLLNHPDHIHELLVKQPGKVQKWDRMKEKMGKLTGDGLLVSDGDSWRQQRKLVQPSLHTLRIGHYADIMSSYTLRMIDAWEDGQELDLQASLIQLTMSIITKALFNADFITEATPLFEASRLAQELVVRDMGSIIALPEWIPTPRKRREQEALKTLHDYIMLTIKERQENPGETEDLLSALLEAKDEDGNKMTVEQIYNEAMTLFMAGHDSTSNALTWLWYLLLEHPDAEQTLSETVTRVLQGNLPTFESLKDLQYIEMLFKETIRLYPPVWAFMRQAVEEVQIGGYAIPAGSMIYVSPWVIHRDARFFENPTEFRPERFSAENEPNIKSFSYFPFGGGPRVCIGNHFAMMEAKITTALINQRVKFELVAGQSVEIDPGLTLRPRNGLRVIVRKR